MEPQMKIEQNQEPLIEKLPEIRTSAQDINLHEPKELTDSSPKNVS